MSYLHCPTCASAYNVAREPACPRCGIRPGTPADPMADVIGAVEQLARAMARATPTELAAAEALLATRDAQLALPAPGALPAPAPALLRAVRAALASAPSDDAPPRETLATRLVALLARVAPERRASWRITIEAMLVRLTPRLPAATSTDAPPRSLASARAWARTRVRSTMQQARSLLARAA